MIERVSSRGVEGAPRACFVGIGAAHSHRALCLVECLAVAALKFLIILNKEPASSSCTGPCRTHPESQRDGVTRELQAAQGDRKALRELVATTASSGRDEAPLLPRVSCVSSGEQWEP